MTTGHVNASTPKVYPRLRRKLRIVMVLGLIFGPVVVGIGLLDYRKTLELRTKGVRVTGRVVDADSVATGKGRTSHQITVEYQPTQHQAYRKQFTVDREAFQTAQRVGKVTVTFLPSDPTLSAAGEHVRADGEPFAIGTGVFGFGLLLWIYFRRTSARAAGLEPGPSPVESAWSLGASGGTMPLEEPNKIDMIVRSPDGKPRLVITDAGQSVSEAERLRHLLAKLRTCVSHIMSNQFAKDYPGVKPSEVTIEVMCRVPASEQMTQIKFAAAPEDPSIKIPIEYTHFPAP